MDDLQKIITRYSERFRASGSDPMQTLKPGSPEHYRAQHQAHVDALPPEVESILDVGCGMGNFRIAIDESPKFKCRKVRYTGIDIVPDFINYCRHRFRDDTFFQGTLEQYIELKSPRVDAVVFCQVFNNRYENLDNFEEVKKCLTAAYLISKSAVTCDLIGDYVNYRDSFLYYYSPEALFTFAKTLTPYVRLDNSYSKFHFTLAFYKNNW
jgi:ubiquinone/menaquinone biosynthesis C-methylase UbiE